METLGGETLAHLIGPPPAAVGPELAFLGLQLSSAVGYLHRHGVLHLDLKPSNIVAEAGRAKLIDLSVARAPGRAKAGMGTWRYMAPEQARAATVGRAADVWGVGVVLWSAIWGDTPFSDESREYPQLDQRAPAARRAATAAACRWRAPSTAASSRIPPSAPRCPSWREALAPVAGARG